MSAPFLGYLLKIANSSIIFPNHYIQYETWKSTPNQREEIKAYRDDNTRDLFRVTAEGRKTIISFSTRPGLDLQDKLIIQDFFNCGETEFNGDVDERKIHLTYWNDEDNCYKSGYFYRPNIEYPIRAITQDNIKYGEIKITLVEY